MGPTVFKYVEADEAKPTAAPAPTEAPKTEVAEVVSSPTAEPSTTPITVTVETRSLIPGWVYVVLPLVFALAGGCGALLETKI